MLTISLWFAENAFTQCTVNAGADITVCANSQVTLGGAPTASGGTGPYTYDWTNLSGTQDIANPTVTVSSTITYTVVITDANGCSASDQMVITVTPLPVANAGNDLDPCVNTSNITLASGGTWSGAPSNMLNGNIFSPNTVGTYNLVYTVTANGCSNTDNLQIMVRPRPTVYAGLDATICPGGCHQLNATASSTNGPITLYTWSGGPLNNSLSQSPIACPTGAGATYSVTVVDSEGCNAQDQVNVSFQAPVPVNAGSDMTVCNNPTPLTLSGQTPTGGTWSGTGVTPSGQFTSPGLGSYTLTYTVSSGIGCTFSDTRVITVVGSQVIDGGADRTACVGSTPFQLMPTTTGGSWSGSSYVSPAGVFTPSVIGSYNLTYSVDNGTCISTDQVVVNVFSLPNVSAGPDKVMCAGASVLLNGSASGGLSPYTINWSNTSSLSASNSLTPTANPATTTTYVLTVTDSRQCSASDMAIVTVSSLPVVNAGPDLTLCDQSPATMLTGQDPAGGTWSGSCVTANGQFTPCGVGTYTLAYTVTNASGCVASDTRVVTVTSSPIANAGVDQSICRNEGTIVLGANSNTPGIWSGTGIADPNTGLFNPIMAGAGTHTITLSVGSGVCLVTDQVSIQVKSEPNVTAGPDQMACYSSGPLDLVGASPAGGEWEGPGIDDDDDDYFDSSIGVGAYNVSYRYTDQVSACADTAYKSVVINSVPVSSFTAPSTVCLNTPFVPGNSSTGAATFQWNFGNGGNINGTAPSNTYTTENNFNIRLVAISVAGCRDTSYQAISAIAAPTVQITSDVNEGCAPLGVHFTCAVTGQDLTYLWNMDDGTTSASANMSYHEFVENNTDNIYAPQLIVSNACGSASSGLLIEVNPRPEAAFVTNFLSTSCTPVTIEFDNTSMGEFSSCSWNFDNGNAANVDEPGSMVFTTGNSPSVFDVELTVQNACGTDTFIQSITVEPNHVHANLSTNVQHGCTPLNLNVSNAGSGATMIQYEFEDGVVAMGSSAGHTYSNPGVYTLYQYATDGCGFDTAFVSIEVFETPQVSFITSADEICQNGSVEFTSTSIGAESLSWSLGDGTSATSINVDKSYYIAGTYNVQLVGTSGICSSTAELALTVHSNPVAQFELAETTSCAPFEICPINSSIGGNSFEWEFGDGSTSSDQFACHEFQNDGELSVERNIVLTVTNGFGCADSVQDHVWILPIPPATFELPMETSCDFPVLLTPLLIDNTSMSYQWTLNGINASSQPVPSFQLAAPGVFELGMEVTNQFGCVNTAQRNFEIFPEVVASFDAVNPTGCLSHTVDFENTSSNAVSYQWHYGDGQSNNEFSPSHLYDTQGVFNVKLIATSIHGCQDSIVKYGFVETYELPEASFTMSSPEVSIFNPEVEFTNTTEDAMSFEWRLGDGIITEEENPVHEYNNPGRWPVTLIVTNMFGCKDMVVREVTVTNDFQVYIPNSFTPNNDGRNDFFQPVMEGLEFITRYDFKVFNRWGEVVFATEDPSDAWEGDAKGADFYSESDTYKFRLVIQLEQSSETKIYEGLVTMIK